MANHRGALSATGMFIGAEDRNAMGQKQRAALVRKAVWTGTGTETVPQNCGAQNSGARHAGACRACIYRATLVYRA